MDLLPFIFLFRVQWLELLKKIERNAGGLKQKSVIVNGMNIQYLEGGKEILDSSGAKILQSIMNNAKAVVLEGIGHAPMIEFPEETAKLYLTFHKINFL